MTNSEDPGTDRTEAWRTRYDELFAEAVAALTEAARLRRPALGRDEAASAAAGHSVFAEIDKDEQNDWAGFVTLALASAAANIGGIEAILAGRPGSWEAEGVRQLLTSAVGQDEAHLFENRTEPVVVTAYVDEILSAREVWDAYDQAQERAQPPLRGSRQPHRAPPGRCQLATAGTGYRRAGTRGRRHSRAAGTARAATPRRLG